MTALPERFWAKVIRRPDGTGCWDWVGATKPNGYGVIRIGNKKDGTRGMRHVHRLSLSAHLGRELHPTEQAMHSCDNRVCVNPTHLSPGTNAENVADMVAKGRQCVGADRKSTKITAKQALEIRADTRQRQVIAREHGISCSNVMAIKDRRSWRHLP